MEAVFFMDKIKRFITCNVPVQVCNFRCSYCYIPQKNGGRAYSGEVDRLPHPVEYTARCFDPERLGGLCFLNFCAPGETLLYGELIPLVKALCEEGHYCSIVTNGVLSKKFDEIVETFSAEECFRLFIKFSFHWMQLKEKNLFDVFVENVNKMKRAGVSYTIEITPHDELVPYIEEIKTFCLKRFGALPHITVARNEATKEIELLTKYSREVYKRIWSQFDSTLFDFKFAVFNARRTEFCRAGELTLNLDLGSGRYHQCFKGAYLGNIYDLKKPLCLRPIGRCKMPHCFNAHGYISLGAIQTLSDGTNIPTYAAERDRICADDSSWLSPVYRKFIEHYAWENSPEVSAKKQKRILFTSNAFLLFSKSKEFLLRVRDKLLKAKQKSLVAPPNKWARGVRSMNKSIGAHSGWKTA